MKNAWDIFSRVDLRRECGHIRIIGFFITSQNEFVESKLKGMWRGDYGMVRFPPVDSY